MKRHILAVGAVLVVLFCMYFHGWLLGKGIRLFYELSPSGFVVSYYADTMFGELVTRRSERKAILNYGDGRPAFGVPQKKHSVRWEGWLRVDESDEYDFFLQSQGGARLWIGEKLVVDKWADHEWLPGEHGACILSSGVHRVVIEHYKINGPGALRLRWAGGVIPGNTIMGAPYVRKKSR
jgi:hypothetical protein